MKKRMMMTAMMLLVLGFATLATAKPVYLAKPAEITVQPITVDGTQFVRYTFLFTDPNDNWMDNTVNFCPDALRDGCDENLPLTFVKKEGCVAIYDTPMEVIARGQSGVNFAKDKNWFDTLWLGLPDSKLKVGDNLVCARSVQDPNIPHSGGTYLLYTGPGAPYVPSSSELGNDGRPVIVPCGSRVVTQVAAPPAPAPPVRKYVPVVTRKQVVKKIPCPDGKGICSQPCIVEIREGVEYLVQSVGMWTRDEPVEERTLQQKARITLDSLGKPDKDDPADEKTVQQKARKALKKTKAIKKSLGEPKDGKTSAHEKLDALQSDVSLIKAEVIKTGGHTLPPAGTSKTQPSCSTVGCHAPK